MRAMLMRTLALMALFLCAWPLRASETSVAGFDAANRLYEQGKYGEAAVAYEKLLQSGAAAPALYYNLGNAYFKAGQIGRAIGAYQQARQFTPRDPDLQANLQFARSQVQGPSISPDWWQKWLGRFSLNEWTILAASGVWILFMLLAAQQWRPAWRPALRNWIVAATACTVVLVSICGIVWYEHRSLQDAIVVARDTQIRQGPLNESPTVFTMHDGAELRVVDRKEDWLQVSVDPRRVGWVRRDQVVIAPGA